MPTGRCGALVITRVGDCYAVVGEEVLGDLEAAHSPSPRLGELRGGRLDVALVFSEHVRAVHGEVVGETRTQLIPLEKIDVLDHPKGEIDDRNAIAQLLGRQFMPRITHGYVLLDPPDARSGRRTAGDHPILGMHAVSLNGVFRRLPHNDSRCTTLHTVFSPNTQVRRVVVATERRPFGSQ